MDAAQVCVHNPKLRRDIMGLLTLSVFPIHQAGQSQQGNPALATGPPAMSTRSTRPLRAERMRTSLVWMNTPTAAEVILSGRWFPASTGASSML